MVNSIFEAIQAHLSMLEMAVQSSQRIKSYATLGDVNQVVNETENRERLISIIGALQSTIETKVSSLTQEDLKDDTIPVLKSWFNDLAIWSERMIDIDKETVELLNQAKEETTKEIASIFKSKEMFKGYNHSVKK